MVPDFIFGKSSMNSITGGFSSSFFAIYWATLNGAL